MFVRTNFVCRGEVLRKILFFLIFVSVLAFAANHCSALISVGNSELALKESDRSLRGVPHVKRLAAQVNSTAVVKEVNGADWTFMVYLDADNNLEPFYIDMFLDMASVGSTSQVNIVVQMDRIKGKYDDRYEDWGDCKRFHVTKDMIPTPESAVKNLTEVNMGDPNILTDFVNWTINSYPANRYCLVLANHGSGCVQSVCFDETSGMDALSLPELSQALNAVMLPHKIDLLYFDACLMGMVEVAYQIRDYVDVMVASEEVSYAGQPYDYYLGNLTANPSMSPGDLANVIVSNFIDFTSAYSLPTTMAGVDLSQISNLKTAVDSFAQKLNDTEGTYNEEIGMARCQAEGYEELFGGGRYIDLYHFAQLIYQYIPDDIVRDAASQVMTQLSNAVIIEDHYDHPNSHGLSIFFPCKKSYLSDFMNDYRTSSFAIDTAWDEFIENHVNITPEKPDFVVVDVYWEPSNPMPGDAVTFYTHLINRGTQDASAYVRFSRDGASVGGTFNFPVFYLIKIYTTLPWTASPGKYNITWTVDPYSSVEEWNETNNQMTKTLIIGYSLTIQTPYSGITVRIDGYGYATQPDGSYQKYVGPGLHSVEVPASVSLASGTRGAFVQWNDGNPSNVRDISVERDLTMTAEYITQYYLTINRNPSYIGETTGEGWYNSGTLATATCTSPVPYISGTQYVFVNWTGDAFGTSTTLELIMDGPKTITANYKRQYNITFQQSGCPIAPNVVIDGVNYSVPCSFWFDENSWHNVTYESPVSGGPGIQYIVKSPPSSPFKASYPTTITGSYTTQFYIGITSAHGTPPSSQWRDKGSSLTVNVQSPAETIPEQSRWLCTGFSVDHGAKQGGTSYTFSGIDKPHEIEFYWTQQFWLQLETGVSGTKIGGTGWYDSGANASISAETPYSEWEDHRFIFVSWSSTGTNAAPISNSTSPETTVTMNNYYTVKATWQEQFYISINSPHGSPPPSQWVNSTKSFYINVTSPADDDGMGTRYRCIGYKIDSGGLQEGTGYTFTNVEEPHTISFEWKVQYYLTVKTDPKDLSPQPNVSPSGFWYDRGESVTLEARDVSGYAFDCWIIDEKKHASGVQSINVQMDKPHTATAKYVSSKFPTELAIVAAGIVVILAEIVTIIILLKRKK